MIDISKALAISDYDCQERRDELTWLAEQASKRRYIAEVGSYKGCTARAMADNTKGMVYCVDTFAGSVGEVEMARELAAHEPGWLFETFRRNTANLKNVHIVKMESTVAATLAAAERMYFDMIFLDASHDEDSFRNDLNAWLPVLLPGGLLCGHDRTWDGISKVLKELVPNHKTGTGAIWYRP